MHMSNIILPQKEDTYLDSFPHLARITHLYANNKASKYKQFKHASIWRSNLVIFV